MKCAILKTSEGLANLVMICDEKGEFISEDISSHLDSIVSNSNGRFLSWRITDHLNLPGGNGEASFDNTFSGAFTDELDGEQVDIDLNAAKTVAHSWYRRPFRDNAYLSVDGGSMHAVLNENGEKLRGEIRAMDDTCQIEIDNASSTEEIKVALRKIGAIE